MSDAEPDQEPEPVEDADTQGDPEGESEPFTGLRTQTVADQVS
jgi:hypothetical protein